MASNKIHLICSSGGVKCLSYMGAFQKLQENEIEIASVSACSMGTVLGAMLCSGKKDLKQLEKAVLDFDYQILKKKKNFYFLKQFWYPYAKNVTPDFSSIMKSLIGEDIMLSEMKIPFSAAALDIRQNRFLVYSSETHPDMKISEVVRIATAIPFLYEPYKLDKHILIDAALASESPVWMATSNIDSLPIVVLKVSETPNAHFKRSIFSFLSNIFLVSAKSHDHFTIMQTPRSVEVSIPCEEMPYDNFHITKDQIEDLILRGQDAMERKLKEVDYNFYQTLDIEEIRPVPNEVNNTDKAIRFANQLMTNYQSENLKRNQVFVSYSRKDKEWLKKFQTYLKVIESFSGIKTWADTAIEPGTEWQKEIERALASTKVAVFLVTSNFLASDFIKEQEMKYFLEISKRENVPILWIAVSACPYEITPLNNIQCANDPQKPLDQLDPSDQNMEFTKICRTIIENMNAKEQN